MADEQPQTSSNWTPPAEPAPSPPEPAAPASPPPPPAQFDPAVSRLGGGAPVPPGKGDGFVAARPLLVVGAAGPDVSLLARKLAEHGYANPVAAGKQQPVLDDALMALVELFQADQGIDPRRYDGEAPPLIPARGRHSGIVDQETWEALTGERLAWGTPEQVLADLLKAVG